MFGCAQPPEPHSQALANKLASEATSDWGQDNMFGTTVYFIYPHRRYKNYLSISFHVLAIHPYMLELHRWKVSTSCMHFQASLLSWRPEVESELQGNQNKPILLYARVFASTQQLLVISTSIATTQEKWPESQVYLSRSSTKSSARCVQPCLASLRPSSNS